MYQICCMKKINNQLVSIVRNDTCPAFNMIFRSLIALDLLTGTNHVYADGTNSWPTDEVAYNAANPKMIWSEPTNIFQECNSRINITVSVRGGIDASNGIIVLSEKPLKCADDVRLCIENYSESNWFFAYMPPIYQCLELGLADSSGAPVAATPAGALFGQKQDVKPGTPKYLYSKFHLTPFAISPKGVRQLALSDSISDPHSRSFDQIQSLWRLDPSVYFDLNKTGEFKLTVIEKVYIFDSNSALRMVVLPPIAIPVGVR